MKYILALLILSLVNFQINCDKPSKVVEYAKSKIGCGYIWGATGQKCNQELIKRLVLNGHVNPNIAKKWIGKQVFDCAGLVAKAFQQVGIKLATGASSAWRKTKWESKGEISSLPKNKVCILYQHANGKMQHTGIYIGNGEYIDSAGERIGVRKSKMPWRWTHWGIPKEFYDVKEDKSSDKKDQDKPVPPGSFPFQAKVTATSGRTVNLRKSASTNAGIVLRIKLGETVTVTGEENDWYKVTYNSASGYMMKKFLNKE